MTSTITTTTFLTMMNYSVGEGGGVEDIGQVTGIDGGTYDLFPPKVVTWLTSVYMVIFVLGLCGNIGTCIVIAKNKSMHTATNYYLFSLAVSDMLLLICGLPTEIWRIHNPNKFIFGPVICFLQSYSAETSANATVLTITAFTIERYLAICHPFLAHSMSKLSRCIRIIIIIWIVALTLAVPQSIQFGIVEEKDQNGNSSPECLIVRWKFSYAFEVSTILFFVFPMMVITILYIRIGWQLKKSSAKRPSLTQHNGNSNMVIRHATQYNNSEMARKRLRHTHAQNRVVKMLIAVVTAFFVCWAPFHAQRLLATYLTSASEEVQLTYFHSYRYLVYVSGILYYLSTCINPILYNLMSNRYRNNFTKTFNCFAKKRRYLPAPVRHVQKNYQEHFLGEALRLVQTAAGDSKTNSSDVWTKTGQQHRFTPQTSQTSFSSSKLETAQALIEIDQRRKDATKSAKISTINSSDDRRASSSDCRSLKTKFMRLFKTGLTQSHSLTQCALDQRRSNSISNSSLKDTDEIDLVCADLVKQMKQVNEVI